MFGEGLFSVLFVHVCSGGDASLSFHCKLSDVAPTRALKLVFLYCNVIHTDFR